METHLKKLILKKGGHLILFYDEWDSESEINTPKEEEILGVVPSFQLHELEFEFESGIIFEDVLIYLNRNLDYWETIIGCHIRDYVKQSFEIFDLPEDKTDTLERLILSWNMTSDKMDGKKSISNPRLDFGAIGTSDGEQTNFGIGASNLSSIKNLPIEIKTDLIIYSENYDSHFLNKKFTKDEDFADWINKKSFLQKYLPFVYTWLFRFQIWNSNSKKNYGQMPVSLFQAIYGIFYELSFYGGPTQKEEFFSEVKSRLEGYNGNH